MEGDPHFFCRRHNVPDAVAAAEAPGPDAWSKPLDMPIIEKIEIVE